MKNPRKRNSRPTRRDGLVQSVVRAFGLPSIPTGFPAENAATWKRKGSFARFLLSSLVLASLLYFFSAVAMFTGFTLAVERFGLFAVGVYLFFELLFRGIVQPRLGLRITALLFAVVVPLAFASSMLEYFLLCLLFLGFGLLSGVFRSIEGLPTCVSAVLLYSLFYFATLSTGYFPSWVFALFMLSFPFYYFALKRLSLRRSALELGLDFQGVFKKILLGVAWAFALFAFVIVFSLSTFLLGLNDQYKVAEVLEFLPFHVLLLAVLIAPFSEELFFRGFLLKKWGVVASSLLFSLFHFGYGSFSEIAAAFFIGVLLALERKQTRSLVSPIVSHLILNATSVGLARLVL